jgi:hypothetical protein
LRHAGRGRRTWARRREMGKAAVLRESRRWGRCSKHCRPQGMAPFCKQRYASEAMSDQDDWEFAGPDHAKAEIRAAVEYLLRGATGGARGDIVQEIIASCARWRAGCRPSRQILWMMVRLAARCGLHRSFGKRDTEGFQPSGLGQTSLNYEPTAGRFKPVILPQSIPIAPTAIAIKPRGVVQRAAQFSRHNLARRVRAPMTLPSPGSAFCVMRAVITRCGCGHQPLCSHRFAYSLDSADCPWLCPARSKTKRAWE